MSVVHIAIAHGEMRTGLCGLCPLPDGGACKLLLGASNSPSGLLNAARSCKRGISSFRWSDSTSGAACHRRVIDLAAIQLPTRPACCWHLLALSAKSSTPHHTSRWRPHVKKTSRCISSGATSTCAAVPGTGGTLSEPSMASARRSVSAGPCPSRSNPSSTSRYLRRVAHHPFRPVTCVSHWHGVTEVSPWPFGQVPAEGEELLDAKASQALRHRLCL